MLPLLKYRMSRSSGPINVEILMECANIPFFKRILYHCLYCITLIAPVDTRRRFNVYKTSIRRCRRRIYVLYTLKRRRVSTGYISQFYYIALDFQVI